MHTANLSFIQLNDYISFLLDNGLIRQNEVGQRKYT